MKIFLLAILFFISLFSISCNSTKADSSAMPMELSKSLETVQEWEAQLFTDGKVDFQGVSFTYDRQIFGKVKAEEIAEYELKEETDKPDYVEPKHCLFTFDLATEYSPMQIAVYPINDFPKMYAVNKSSKKWMEEEVKDFKKVLKDKNFRDKQSQIPYLPFVDAHQDFQVKVKHFPFSGGKGILFLTFWSTQYEFPSNRQLRYVFEGLTDDGKFYVLAEMPTKVNFLTDESTEEYEGYKLPWGKLNDKSEMKKFSAVIQKIGEKLNKLPENEFQPNLNELEKIISTLKIEK